MALDATLCPTEAICKEVEGFIKWISSCFLCLRFGRNMNCDNAKRDIGWKNIALYYKTKFFSRRSAKQNKHFRLTPTSFFQTSSSFSQFVPVWRRRLESLDRKSKSWHAVSISFLVVVKSCYYFKQRKICPLYEVMQQARLLKQSNMARGAWGEPR